MFISHNGARFLRILFKYCNCLQCFLTKLSNSFAPIRPYSVFRFSSRVLSTDCVADLMLVAISLSCCSPGRCSNFRPGTVLARCKIRRVVSFRVVVLRASVGVWLNWDRILWTCACAANHLSVFLFIVRVRCLTPIWGALSLIGSSIRPTSLSARWTPSVGKFGRGPMACRMALLIMPSMVGNCRS